MKHMPLHQLLLILQRKSNLSSQIRLVSEKKLQRHQRKTYKNLQTKLFKIWNDYQDGTLSSMKVLQQYSVLYGPIAINLK